MRGGSKSGRRTQQTWSDEAVEEELDWLIEKSAEQFSDERHKAEEM
jgi:hypothetical protein